MNSEIKLHDADESQRLYAVQDIEGPEAPKLLLERFEIEESTAVRAAISFRLKTLDCQDIYDELFALFRSPDAYNRNAAVGIFAAGSDDTVEYLAVKYQNDADREVRKLILDALFENGCPKAIEAIRSGIEDRAINVRITAVEYLGQLGDRETAKILLSLLKADEEPMLNVSIIEALANIGDETAMTKALSVLAPDGNYGAVDPFLLPEVIEFAAAAGPLEEIPKALEAVSDWNVYSDNVIRALLHACRRGSEICSDPGILDKVVKLARNKEVLEESRYTAVQHLLHFGKDVLGAKFLYQLGSELLEETIMAPAAVEIMCRSGAKEGKARIQEIMELTKDESLRDLCSHLIEEEMADYQREYGENE